MALPGRPPRALHPGPWLPLATAVPALLLLAAGCPRGGDRGGPAGPPSAPGSQAAPITITYAYWSLNRAEDELLAQLKRRFEAAHPELRVELTGLPQRYYEKLQILTAAARPPDAFSANHGRLADFVRAGQVLDLRPRAEADPTLAEAFLPAAWQGAHGLGRDLGRPGLWGLPKDWPPAGLLIYNHDLLASAGVEPPAGSWTWEQFRQACRRLAAAHAPGVHAAALNLYPYSVFSWLYQSGGTLFGPDGQVSADDPRAVAAVDFLLALWREGLSARPEPRHDDSLDQFSTGKVGFLLGTFYTVQSCRDLTAFAWGVAPPLRGRELACSGLPTYVALSSRTPHPDAAWRWARYLSVDGGDAYARAALTVPAARRALAPSTFLSQPPLSRARPALVEALAVSRPPPVHPTIPYERAIEETRSALETAIAQDLSASETMQRLAARLRSLTSSP